MLENTLTRLNVYVINPALQFLFALAFAFFIWGVVEFFLYGDSDESRDRGKRNIIWGLVGLFIMSGFWGIIQILAGTINQPVTHP